jgi:hypothetical protein
MLQTNVPLDEALQNPLIPEDMREPIRDIIIREQVTVVRDPHILLSRSRQRSSWLNEEDRSRWYYWVRLREYQIDTKGWTDPSVRSIDNATDRILAQLERPSTAQFDVRGLVLGYVQSGKTANFTGLIAKAVDVGYRLVIVLSGVHNVLRQQTQRRLMAELVGYPDGRPGAVPLPPKGKWWATYTSDRLDGDFEPGNVNYAALQGSQPVLMVIKKNGSVLEKLQQWLDVAPDIVRRTLPVLVIDDEADLASVNTGGDRPPEDMDDEDEAEEPDVDTDTTPPSRINALIRGLLRRFDKSAYVAYTATPFANILIRHDAVDREAGEDLYPRDFIVDLPKPEGYYGAEEIFGRPDSEDEHAREGLNVIRLIPEEEVEDLIPPKGFPAEDYWPMITPSMENAILDFVLAGAARRQRGDGKESATMLIHTHLRTVIQHRLADLVRTRVAELRDAWRYEREYSIRNRLEERWVKEFRPLTRSLHSERDVSFDILEEHVGPFFEAIQIKEINSATLDELDYQREPDLKAIAIGGNRLSRGLTLEGLLISYYVRRATMYDTLMQMGRWFGFREGYEDLTRIYTTQLLASWFRELARVEYELRSDIQVYEVEGITPEDLGPRIRKHPAMLVTSRLKMRNASEITINQSFDSQLLQTIIFPEHSDFLQKNVGTAHEFVSSLGPPADSTVDSQPVWTKISWRTIIGFLGAYRVSGRALEGAFPSALIRAYIEQQAAHGELTDWVVAIKGLQNYDRNLKSIDLGVAGGGPINCIRRTRLVNDPDSLGVLTSPIDEATGLDLEQQGRAEELHEGGMQRGKALREVRPKANGLLLIYPVSRYSRPSAREESTRRQLFDKPEEHSDIIGIALSFPRSDTAAAVQGIYVIGTVGWRPM